MNRVTDFEVFSRLKKLYLQYSIFHIFTNIDDWRVTFRNTFCIFPHILPQYCGLSLE